MIEEEHDRITICYNIRFCIQRDQDFVLQKTAGITNYIHNISIRFSTYYCICFDF